MNSETKWYLRFFALSVACFLIAPILNAKPKLEKIFPEKEKSKSIVKCAENKDGSISVVYVNGKKEKLIPPRGKRYFCPLIAKPKPRQPRPNPPPPEPVVPEYPKCGSPSYVQPAEGAQSQFCAGHQSCAQGTCGELASCVSNDETVTITLADGKTQTYPQQASGAKYICKQDQATGRPYLHYAYPCYGLHHRWDGRVFYQCALDRPFCALGTCSTLTNCEQVDARTIRITLSNGDAQTYTSQVGYRCLNTPSGMDAQETYPCQDPFQKQGHYCGSNNFCAQGVCRPLSNCQQINDNTIAITLDSGEQQQFTGAYRCVVSGGATEVRRFSPCTSPYGQESLCGSKFVDGDYQHQFCADGICSLLASCQQVDEDTVNITLDAGGTQTFDGYTCVNDDQERATDIRSTAPTSFSCYGPSQSTETNTDGRVVETTLCHRYEACAEGHCSELASCVSNDQNLTVTLSNGTTQTYPHQERGARYFCLQDPATDRPYLNYALPCYSPVHQWDGYVFRQCSPIGAYCAQGTCAALAGCEQIDADTVRVTLVNGTEQTYRFYHCEYDAQGNLTGVRHQ